MENTTMTRTGNSAWARPGMCIAPVAQLQGSGLPFAGYVVTDAATAKPRHTVPDPRGRQR